MYWLGFMAILGYLGLAGLLFYLATSEVFVVEVGSGTWTFALLLLVLIVVLNMSMVLHPTRYPLYIKLFLFFSVMALVSVVTYLGLKYQPFRNIRVRERIGALFNGGEVTDFLDLPTASNEFQAAMPSVLDQGNCGSCWAYAGALSLSASLNGYKEKQLACVEAKDVSKWVISPQALIDLDTVGKCDGSYTKQGLALASIFPLPDAKCVPGYSSAWKGSISSCKTSCNSPATQHCLIAPTGSNDHSFCADGTVAEKSSMLVGRQVRRVRGSEDTIRAVIESYGPVVAFISFYSTGMPLWTLQREGLFGTYNNVRVGSNFVAMPADDDNYRIEPGLPGHAVVIYGWGTRADGVRYWVVQNSWGENWGDIDTPGSLKIQRGVNAWGLESDCFVLI